MNSSKQIETMLHIIVSMAAATVMVSSAAAQSEGNFCSRDGDRIASAINCKEYLECQHGTYISEKCGFWEAFDIVWNECRWSPLATCRKKSNELATSYEAMHGAAMFCNTNDTESCTVSVAVLGECRYFCDCLSNTFTISKCDYMDYQWFDPINQVCSNDGTCCEDTPMNYEPGTHCSKEGEKRPYLGNCKLYQTCSKGVWGNKNCGFGYYFNPADVDCDINWFGEYC